MMLHVYNILILDVTPSTMCIATYTKQWRHPHQNFFGKEENLGGQKSATDSR